MTRVLIKNSLRQFKDTMLDAVSSIRPELDRLVRDSDAMAFRDEIGIWYAYGLAANDFCGFTEKSFRRTISFL